MAMAEAAGIESSDAEGVMAHMVASAGTFVKAWPATEDYGSLE